MLWSVLQKDPHHPLVVKWKSLSQARLRDPNHHTVHGILQARIPECVVSFLQGIFPTKRPTPGLPYCRWTLYQLSHKGSPRMLEWVAYPFSSRSSQPRNWTGISCIDGQGGLACCGSRGLEESDTTERLNWTELLRCRRILCQREALITLTDWLTRWSKGHTSPRPLVSGGLHLLCGEWAVAFSTLQRGSQTPQESSGLGNMQPSVWRPAGVLYRFVTST